VVNHILIQRERRVLPGSLDRWSDPAGDGGDLKGAPLSPPVAALAGFAGDGDLAPGQGRELGVQARLVALDGEQVVRAAAGQVSRELDLIAKELKRRKL
jgi:hypothetical protein